MDIEKDSFQEQRETLEMVEHFLKFLLFNFRW